MMKGSYTFILVGLLLVNENDVWSQVATSAPFLDHYLESCAGVPRVATAASKLLHPADLTGHSSHALMAGSELRYAGTGIRSNHISYARGQEERGWGVGLHRYGGQHFQSVHLALAYSQRLTRVLTTGLQIGWKREWPDGGSRRSVPGFLISVNGRFNDQLCFYFSVQDPVSLNFSGRDGPFEHSGSVYRMGLVYSISPVLFLNGGFIKTEGGREMLRISLHYVTGDWLMRVGTVTGVPQTFSGFGWKKKKFQTEISASYHLHLGMCPSLMVTYHFPSSKNSQ